jgi:hypothetical protein
MRHSRRPQVSFRGAGFVPKFAYMDSSGARGHVARHPSICLHHTRCGVRRRPLRQTPASGDAAHRPRSPSASGTALHNSDHRLSKHWRNIGEHWASARFPHHPRAPQTLQCAHSHKQIISTYPPVQFSRRASRARGRSAARRAAGW